MKTYISVLRGVVFGDKQLYLCCPNGCGKTKLTTNFIEKKLGINGTANSKTITEFLKIANNKILNSLNEVCLRSKKSLIYLFEDFF